MIPFGKRGGGPDGVLAVPLDEALPYLKETNSCTRKESINPRSSDVSFQGEYPTILYGWVQIGETESYFCGPTTPEVPCYPENIEAGSPAAVRLAKFTLNEGGFFTMNLDWPVPDPD